MISTENEENFDFHRMHEGSLSHVKKLQKKQKTKQNKKSEKKHSSIQM